MAENEEQGLYGKEEIGSEGSDEASVIQGGPGDASTDTIVNPPEGERPIREEEPGTEGEPKRRFKSWDEAERAHSESEKRMRRAFEEIAGYKRMLAETGGGRTTEQPPPQKKALWTRERESFEAQRKAIPLPDINDAKAVNDYNDAVADLYFRVHSEFTDLGMQERAQAQETSNRMQGWIETEASKYGFTDEEFDLKNEDGTVEKGTLRNVFWSVCQSPESFGISVRDGNGRVLPLPEQVKAVAVGINRFLDSYFNYRLNRDKVSEGHRRDLTVLRRGSSGPGKKGGEEEEEISTFADGIKQNLKNRKRAGDLRRRGD